MSRTPQEVITLQFGNYSNFVGTHYWNTQKERIKQKYKNYAKEKLFRETSNKHEPERPRVIYFDSRESLKSLREDGSYCFSTNQNEAIMPDKELAVYEQPGQTANEFITQVFKGNTTPKSINFDDIVSAWSDYMTAVLTHHSIQLSPNNFNDSNDMKYFGKGVADYMDIRDDIDDKLHYWVEECDNLEGFQLMIDVHNGFSGLASNTLEDLRDEYDRKCNMAFVNCPVLEFDQSTSVYRNLNAALTLQSLSKHTNLFSLQSLQKNLLHYTSDTVLLPFYEYKASLDYHTSAILSTVLDSVTQPWRIGNRTCSMSDMCYAVTQDKWKMASVSMGHIQLEDDEPENNFFNTLCSLENYESILTSLFPLNEHSDVKPFCQALVLQNLPNDFILPAKIRPETLQKLYLNRNIFNRNPLQLLEFFTEKFYPKEKTFSKSMYTEIPPDFSLPYPSILKAQENISDIPMMSSLYTSSEFYCFLHNVVLNLRRININKYPELVQLGLDRDTLQELQEDLVNLASLYSDSRTFNELS